MIVVNNKFKVAILASVVSVFFYNLSCKKPVNPNEEELISTVVFNLSNGIKTNTFQWKIIDGNISTDTVVLDSGINYQCNLQFLDETKNPKVDLTEEIKSESKSHYICYDFNGSVNLIYKDSDGAFPIGLQTEWKATKKGIYNLKLQLKHQPDVKNGTCNVGETDVEAYIPVRIK